MELNELNNYGIKTPRFTLCGLKTNGRLVDIIDGDSLTIVLPMYNNYYKFNVRLNGIDASEISSKDGHLKDIALNARNALFTLLTNKDTTCTLTRREIQNYLNDTVIIVWVECLEFDKYGRLLANVFSKDICLSKYLLDNHLVYDYHGEKKQNEDEQLKFFENI